MHFIIKENLVGGWTNPLEKYESKWESSAIFGVNITKSLKPPPRNPVEEKTLKSPTRLLTGSLMLGSDRACPKMDRVVGSDSRMLRTMFCYFLPLGYTKNNVLKSFHLELGPISYILLKYHLKRLVDKNLPCQPPKINQKSRIDAKNSKGARLGIQGTTPKATPPKK